MALPNQTFAVSTPATVVPGAKLEQFCDTPFWDPTLSWWSKVPDLTPCFQFVIIRLIPCFFFWLVVPIKLSRYHQNRVKNNRKAIRKCSKITIIKMIVSGIIVLTLLGELIQSISLYAGQIAYRPTSQFLTPAIELVTIIWVAIVIRYERRHAYAASGLFWFFCLIASICYSIVFYSAVINYVRVTDSQLWSPLVNFNATVGVSNITRTIVARPVASASVRWNVDIGLLLLTSFRYVAILVLFGLCCVADHVVDSSVLEQDLIAPEFGNRVSPEVSAGFPSRLMFGWVWPLVRRGAKKALEAGDLYSLRPEDRSSTNAPRFERTYSASVSAWRHQCELDKANGKANSSRKSSLKRAAKKNKDNENEAEPGKRSKMDETSASNKNGKDTAAVANPKMALVIEDDENDGAAEQPLMDKNEAEIAPSDNMRTPVKGESKKKYSVAASDEPKSRFGRLKARRAKAKDSKAKGKPAAKPPSAFELDKTKYPSAMRALLRVYWKELLKAHSCKVVQDIMLFTNTAVIGLLIRFADDPERANYVWRGALFAIALACSQLVQSISMQNTFDFAMRCGVHMRTSLATALYRKALTISNSARAKATLGEIVNLMSVDAQRIQDFMGYSWALWSCPEQIIVACVLIWFQMGVATLAGLAAMVLLVLPANMVVATRQRKLQIMQMRFKDERIKMVNELLAGIRLVKLYVWEKPFRRRVSTIRDREIENLRRAAYLGVVQNFIFTFAPYLVSVVTFAVFVVTSDEELTAQRAFVTLSLFQILRFPMGILPMIIQMSVTAIVAVKRISRFLAQPDLNEANVSHVSNAAEPVTIDDATFGWSNADQKQNADESKAKESAILRDVTLHVRSGELMAVVGRVGSGKSTLISTILGETELIKGNVNVDGSVAYVAQQSWIQNASLRDNILFGAPFDEEKYNRVIRACALEADLAMLPGGDKTEIGEKGINLSGGQKQRVSLARAVYADAQIYLLDDPLSAVDVHVGRHIFDQVIGPNGLLNKKTRVFSTHGLQWLRECDRVAVIDQKSRSIVQLGPYAELIAASDSFLLNQLHLDNDRSRELAAAESETAPQMQTTDADAAEVKEAPASPVKKQQSVTEEKEKQPNGKDKAKQLMTAEEEAEAIRAAVKKQEEQKLIQEEKRETGRVNIKVYLAYLRAQSLPIFVVYIVSLAVINGLFVLGNWWVAIWTGDPRLTALASDCSLTSGNFSFALSNYSTISPLSVTSTITSIAANATCYNKDERNALRGYYMLIFGVIGLTIAVVALISAILNAVSSVRASRVLHASMLDRILHVPMSFFDTTPTGRILNRFSKDIELIDHALPHTFRGWLQTMFGAIFTLIGVCLGMPLVIALVVPAGIIFFFVQRFFVPTSRQLKRLESVSKSPVFTHYSESLQGRATIRAFGASDQFVAEAERRIDRNNVYCILGLVANRWIAMNLDFISALFVAGAAAFCVIGSVMLDTQGGRVGLSLTYSLSIAQTLNWMVRMNSEIETNIVSVERIQEYSELEQEAEWERSEADLARDSVKLTADWPVQGNIEFDKYSTRYRENLDLVLREISLRVEPASKVGIVGRTGAGKSSLTLALFRMIESVSGRINIDDIDIARLGVHQLRSRLTILPQDPVIFAGSLRSNLDPFETHTDEQVWNALEMSGLREHFASQGDDGLLYECSEGGSNLSVGQRQLVCLARALLRKTKVLILDEATAAVDLRTDELIQRTIRTAFADCTVITIAHRLNTIMDYDKILVLDRGSVAEFDSPAALLARPDSIFASMVRDAKLTH